MDVKAIRRQLGWTQSQLAERLPTTIRTIGRWENEAAQPHQIAQARLKAILHEFEQQPEEKEEDSAGALKRRMEA